MTGTFWLDWAILALSLTNTILLMWLGTTVLLNTERRTWGGWLAAAGLLLGGTFFISHTAILGYGFNVIGPGFNLWWVVGLMAVTALPFLWYVMMLWYSGFWQPPAASEVNTLRRRHGVLLAFVTLMLIGLFLIALSTLRSRSYSPIPAFPTGGLSDSISFHGIPLVIVVYPLYVVICLLFSLDALRKPGPSQRRMGEVARKRARPWLLGASAALLVVSLAVGGVFAWLLPIIEDFGQINEQLMTIGYFDLVIEALIALAVLLLGQSVVSYEIFTGQSLPRQGFIRQWQRAVLLAVGYGVVIGFTFSANLRPIYGLLLSALLMTFFFSMLSWRMVSERQRTIASLRPFVASQRFYDQLLTARGQIDTDVSLQMPFNALCREVLNTTRACLVALGPMAPLVGPPLCYPGGGKVDEAPLNLGAVLVQIGETWDAETPLVRIFPEVAEGMEWAIPLWSQRGLVGVLLFGAKRDEGIYSREEVEVAQASGERLIDTRASAEIAQRLMALQRQRLAESQVLDQRTRRVLHDEVLQQVHAAMLTLDRSDGAEAGREKALTMLAEVHGDISDLLRQMPRPSLPVIEKLGVVGALKTLLDEEYVGAFDQVVWQVVGNAEERFSHLPQLEAEVLYYAAREAVRNAAKYARATGEAVQPLTLTIRAEAQDGLRLTVADDGVGIRPDADGGQGLALHGTMMAVIGGELNVDSQPGEYTRVVLHLPVY
ncbi:hypothetical protein KQH61_04970 [bacterium]|nr:hypothetical protein [bacterium]MCB2179253.1 hypothetical protein [bacterium]